MKLRILCSSLFAIFGITFSTCATIKYSQKRPDVNINQGTSYLLGNSANIVDLPPKLAIAEDSISESYLAKLNKETLGYYYRKPSLFSNDDDMPKNFEEGFKIISKKDKTELNKMKQHWFFL